MSHWKQFMISDCGTHHLMDGSPVYTERFDTVLAFHEPGLAPVQSETQAWHIDASGEPSYPQRFVRTFGFYEGLAAVQEQDGQFHHILPSGNEAYSERYAWCGNFQRSRCSVRDQAGWYFHINTEGRAAYSQRWKYAGDFYHHYAVVQSTDGLSTHIDAEGQLLHSQWFLDLDVFHKGYARAREEAGWMHVDTDGKAIYTRRFALVEPFYNGQARVERLDGGLEVIDERGVTLVELRPAQREPLHQVSAELVSFWRCEAIFAAVDLSVFDSLPLQEPSPTMLRLLNALGDLGFVQQDGAEWNVTSTGAYLRSDHPKSLVPAAKYWAKDGREGWKSIRQALDTADWMPKDPFAKVAQEGHELAAYHAAMEVYAEHDYADIAQIIDESSGVLIDAGGATGTLAKKLLRSNPELSAIVMEREEVCVLGSASNESVQRLRFVAGDLFSPWPCVGNSIVLARVLHDWPDDRCIELLRHAKDSLDANGRLYIVELVRSSETYDAGLLSLHMLVTTGGQERTEEEFRCLLNQGGFCLVDVRSSLGLNHVLVAEPI